MLSWLQTRARNRPSPVERFSCLEHHFNHGVRRERVVNLVELLLALHIYLSGGAQIIAFAAGAGADLVRLGVGRVLADHI